MILAFSRRLCSAAIPMQSGVRTQYWQRWRSFRFTFTDFPRYSRVNFECFDTASPSAYTQWMVCWMAMTLSQIQLISATHRLCLFHRVRLCFSVGTNANIGSSLTLKALFIIHLNYVINKRTSFHRTNCISLYGPAFIQHMARSYRHWRFHCPVPLLLMKIIPHERIRFPIRPRLGPARSRLNVCLTLTVTKRSARVLWLLLFVVMFPGEMNFGIN